MARCSMPLRRLSKNANGLLKTHANIQNRKNFCGPNLLSTALKKNSFFKLIRNMSSTNKDGEDIDLKKSNQNQTEKRNKNVFRRRLKIKRLKNFKIKCKRCNKQFLNKSEVPKTGTDELVNKEDLNIIKSEPANMTTNEGISQSQLPPKKLHVEFMESHNLKDFNLNKNQPNKTYNKKPNVIDIKIFPLKVTDEKTSHFLKMVTKNSLSTLKPTPSENANKNSENLPVLKYEKNRDINAVTESLSDLPPKINNSIAQDAKIKSFTDMVLKSQIKQNISLLKSKETKIEDNDRNKTVFADNTKQLKIPRADILTEESKDNGLIEPNARDIKETKIVERRANKYSDLPKVNFSNQNDLHEKITSQEYSDSFKKSNNIRILYQARPKKQKTVINKFAYNPEVKGNNPSSNIRKETKEFNIRNSEANPESKVNIASKGKSIDSVHKRTDQEEKLPDGKGTLYPTKLGKFLNINIESKGFASDKSATFDRISKGVLYPTKETDTRIWKIVKSNRHTKAIPNIIDKTILTTTTVKQELKTHTSSDKNHIKSETTNFTDTRTLKIDKSNKQTKAVPNIVDKPNLKTMTVKQELNAHTSSEKIKSGTTNFTEQLPPLIKIAYVKKAKEEENKRTKDIEKELQTKKSAVKLTTFKQPIKQAKVLIKITNNLSSAATKSSLQNSKNLSDQAVNKKNLSRQSQEKSEDLTKKSSINMFGEYMSADKLKEIEEKLKFINTDPLGARPCLKKTVLKQQGATTLKTDKLAKSRKSSRAGGSRGGTTGGGGGDRIKQNATNIKKGGSSRFWRNLTLSVLPLLVSFAIYIFSSTAAIEVFRRMHLTSSKDGPFGMQLLPAFYKTDAENNESNETDEYLEENAETQDGNNDANETETINLFEDHRLDET